MSESLNPYEHYTETQDGYESMRDYEFLENDDIQENVVNETELDISVTSEIDLFSIKVKFFTKNSVTQRNGKLVVTDMIVCGDVEKFKSKVWIHISMYVKRKVRLKGDSASEKY